MNKRTCYMCGKIIKTKYEKNVGMCIDCIEDGIDEIGSNDVIYDDFERELI